jgi:hypothetical protein
MNIVFKAGVLIRSSFEVVSDVTYIHTESLAYTIKKIDIYIYGYILNPIPLTTI